MTYKQSASQLDVMAPDIKSISYNSKVFKLIKMSIKLTKLIALIIFPPTTQPLVRLLLLSELFIATFYSPQLIKICPNVYTSIKKTKLTFAQFNYA